jgi:hypothetical protein
MTKSEFIIAIRAHRRRIWIFVTAFGTDHFSTSIIYQINSYNDKNKPGFCEKPGLLYLIRLKISVSEVITETDSVAWSDGISRISLIT